MTPSTLQATSRFYGEHPALRLLRPALGATERLWPALAVRAAYRLFGTPLPLRRPGRAAALGDGWRGPQAQDTAPRAVVAHTRAALQRRIEAREGILMRQFEPPAVGPRIALPTLVVHDRGDRINRFADGEAYRDHIPHARLLATEGLGHRKLLQQAEVLAAVADFVAG